MGRIEFGSKVAVGAFGKVVSVIDGTRVGVSPSDKGWKGVRVGVASDGAVTRKRVVGEAAGNSTGEFSKGAAQLANIKKMSTAIRSALLMAFLLLICTIYG